MQQALFPAQRGDQGASLLPAMELGGQRCAQGFSHLDWGKIFKLWLDLDNKDQKTMLIT